MCVKNETARLKILGLREESFFTARNVIAKKFQERGSPHSELHRTKETSIQSHPVISNVGFEVVQGRDDLDHLENK